MDNYYQADLEPHMPILGSVVDVARGVGSPSSEEAVMVGRLYYMRVVNGFINVNQISPIMEFGSDHH